MNNNNVNDIENQNFIIEGKFLDNDEIFINHSNSPLERFKNLNQIFEFNSSNSFRKSASYPNNYIMKFNLDKKLNIKTNNIDTFEISSNPLINSNNNNIDENNELSTLIIKKNINKLSYTNYLYYIYYWCKLDNMSTKIEILNKFISIILHIFIMIIFEIYFYFNFVVNIEKQQFLDKIQQYINQFTSNLNFNDTQKDIIYKLIKNEYDTSFMNELYRLYVQSLQQQKQLLHHLLIKSCGLAGIIGLVLIGLLSYGFFKGYKIKWKWICVENFLMFAILGIFEYWFFMNVILNYNPITDAEIKYYVANQFVNYFNSTI